MFLSTECNGLYIHWHCMHMHTLTHTNFKYLFETVVKLATKSLGCLGPYNHWMPWGLTVVCLTVVTHKRARSHFNSLRIKDFSQLNMQQRSPSVFSVKDGLDLDVSVHYVHWSVPLWHYIHRSTSLTIIRNPLIRWSAINIPNLLQRLWINFAITH